MNKKIKNGIISFVICFGVSIMLNLAMWGIPILGLPDVEDIVRVEIVNTRIDNEPRIFTDKENMELALQVTGCLKYTIGDTDENEGFITIRYEESDGTITEISASDTAVFWKGEAYPLKDEETFVNVVEGIFFFGEVVEAENNGEIVVKEYDYDHVYSIEAHEWEFSHMQDGNGAVTGCSDRVKEKYPEAEIKDITIATEDGKLHINDNSMKKEWSFEYERADVSDEAIIYNLYEENLEQGNMVSTITKYSDGNEEYALIVKINDYTLYFAEGVAE